MSKRPAPTRRHGVDVLPPLHQGEQFRSGDGLHVIYAIKGRGKNRAALLASFKDGKRAVTWVKVFTLKECLAADDAELYTGAVCRVCGCVDDNCQHCIDRTGEPCSWIEPDLCSACTGLIDLAYQAGVDAANIGNAQGSNPHELWTLADNDLWAAWRKGWIERKNEVALNSLKNVTRAARRAGVIA